MKSPRPVDLRGRVDERVGAWRIDVERLAETGGSILAFGQRHGQPVVLKVIRNHGDEWRSGEVLRAFDGRGVVRVLEHAEGAVLLERLEPGHSLVRTAIGGNDDQATIILADVIRRMSPRGSVTAAPTVEEWGRAFARYLAADDGRIPRPVVESARRVYMALCASQSAPRLLHGDLHHDNVLFDAARGWIAIDPKGVVGELEYEVGAALRNPCERPDLFSDPAVVQRRVAIFARDLHLDVARMLAWAYAQAVLAVVWAVEDGDTAAPLDAWLALARNARPLLDAAFDP